MPSADGKLVEIRQDTHGLSGVLACPPGVRPAAGQYLLACGDHPSEVIATPLFPAGPPGGDLVVAPPLPEHWVPGQTLHLRGPLGHGFTLPASARHVALCAQQAPPSLLLPLAIQALERGAAVALYTDQRPMHLAEDIEVLPVELLPEALVWADYLAACLPQAHLAAFRRSLGLPARQPARCPVEVLLLAPMPCGGPAECGVCAVLTRSGWQHICSDGPVFKLDQLEEG